MKLLCLYQVMSHYRVGTYEAISKLPNVDFELQSGKDLGNKINFVSCTHLFVDSKELRTKRFL